MRSLKSRFSRISVVLVAFALAFAVTPAQAQTDAGFSDYFVLGQAEHIFAFMNRVRLGEGSNAFPTPSRMNSVASATTTGDGQIVYYDHWEDGLEADIQGGGSIAISSITRLAGVVTVTTSGPHGFAMGQNATIIGATPANYNGTFIITGTTATTFTYNILTLPATPATVTATTLASAHQATTLVLGDGDSNNGKACDWTVDPRVACGSANEDKLFAGTPLSLASDAGLTGTCAAPYAAPPSLAQIDCSIPISPTVASMTRAGNVVTVTVSTATGHSFANGATVRISGANESEYNGNWVIATAGPASLTFTYTRVPAFSGATPTTATGTITATFPTIRFDGGDRVFTAGGSLSIAHIQDPGTPLIGGGTELIARELVKDAIGYSIPVGEDLFITAGAGFNAIKYESLDIVAFDDNTSITLTSPGGTGGTRSLVLHRGQHYFTCATFGAAVPGAGAGSPSLCTSGSIEGPPPPSGADNRGTFPSLALTVNAGTKVSTTGPLNIQISTGGGGGNGQAAYGTRHYATLPDILHTTDYVTTAPGDNTGVNGARPLNLFVYNPNPTTAITVNWTDTGGTGSFMVNPNSVVDYVSEAHTIPNNSSVRLTSTRPFWGLSAYDHLGFASDWGHAWLGVRFLKSDYTLAYSPGTQVVPVISVTRAGTTVTVTTGVAHNVSVNSLVRIAGVDNGGSLIGFNGDFQATAVTATTITYTSLTNSAVAATAVTGTEVAICEGTGTRPCDSFNRDPVWVAGTQNNTQVRVDLDANTLWDFIDIDSDGCPDSGDVTTTGCSTPVLPTGCVTAPTPNTCAYLVNAPGSAGRNVLRVWDPYDLNNAGTRIVSSRPVALAWGQDVDQDANGADPSPDNGYTIYPAIALDLVLGIQKDVSPTRVPLAGGPASYTVRIFSGDYGPITFIAPQDLLPPGVPCSAYATGTSVITYPDLSTSTANPTCTAPVISSLTSVGVTATVNSTAHGFLVGDRVSITGATSAGANNYNGTFSVVSASANQFTYTMIAPSGSAAAGGAPTIDGGRGRLRWLPTQTTLLINQETVITYTLNIPSTTRTLSSLTSAGTVATATSTNHGFLAGQTVVIAGATSTAPNNYNGTFVITGAPTVNTFTYTMAAASGSTTAGGTITAAGGSRSLENEAEVSGFLGSSRFNPRDTALLNQSDLSMVKSVVDDGSPEVGDILTYTIAVRNGGSPETVVSVLDSIPPFTSYVMNSVNAPTAVSGITQAAGIATVTMPIPHNYITGATITIAGATPAAFNGSKIITVTSPTMFTFPIVTAGPVTGVITATPHSGLNPTFNMGANAVIWDTSTRALTAITNAGTTYTATMATPPGFLVGQLVTIAGATSAAPNNYNGTFAVTGVTGTQFTYTNTASGAAASGGARTVAAANVPANGVQIFTFQAQILASTPSGTVIPNTANYSSVLVPSFDSNTVETVVLGPVLELTKTGPPGPVNPGDVLDYELLLRNTGTGAAQAVVITDNVAATNTTYVAGSMLLSVNGGPFTALSDAVDADGGNFTGTVITYNHAPLTLLPGSTLRLRFKARVNPGTGGLYAFNQAVANATGQPPAPSNLYQVPIVTPPGVVSISKTSSGGGTVTPGQVVTYTVVVQNDTSSTQTNTVISDPLPTGTTFVGGSASVSTSSPVFRSTEYFVPAGSFAGTSFTQTLNQDLAANYFVIVQGSSTTAATPPSANYIRLDGDPYGTGNAGGLAGIADIVAAAGGPNNVLRFARNTATGSWTGVITVVECLTACSTAGFQLLDAGAVTQAANTLTAAPTSDVAWLAGELPRIMLMAGFQGAGCTTASAVAQDTKVCHSRWTPSGTATMTWNRNAGGTSTTPNILAAVNTVMVIRWGSEWTVQLKRINAANGGTDVDGTADYNVSTALAGAGVARANTWVWGTGFTTNNEQRNASEGVVLTLGDGVAQNATETRLAAGQWTNAQTIDFDVYALTHPRLAVNHRFKASDATNDPATLIYDQTTVSGGGARMSLSYQGNSLNDNNYPQSMFSARFLSPSQIRLQRTQAAGTFAGWTQGINFSSVNADSTPVFPGHAPSNLVVAADGFQIAPGGALTLTYQVTVNASPGTPTIVNTATFSSTQVPLPGISSTVVDNVAIPKVRVEPNNAGFVAVPTTPAGNTILFTQGVTNLGTTADSFAVTLNIQKNGWKLELIDPATGIVIATDTNGDGVWDGAVTISTGSLAIGATKQYTVRATVPFGTALGFQNTVELTATSVLSALVKDVGTDEITVLDPTYFGPIVLLPDHSGIVSPGGTIAYTHRLFNNTGVAARFDLTPSTVLGWTTTVHTDTNGDGVYTPGTDVAITNSSLLANGGSEILFVVTTAPVGATAGVDDVAHLIARSRPGCTPSPACNAYVDSVTDTTTILAATTHDLAGGGTRMAAAGDTTIFPGTLYNLSVSADRFDISLTASSLFGVDGLNHPTVLRVGPDANMDGLLDTIVATDSNGDGIWDSITGGFNTNANGQPDLAVGANNQIEYQLVRAISPSQKIWLEYVTATATSLNTPTQKDSITAQWIIASLSRASIRGLRVDPKGFVEFVTGSQKDTASFNLYSTRDRSLKGEKTLLNSAPVQSPAPDSVLPILYKVKTSTIDDPYLIIEETETTGNVFSYGPYSIVNTRLLRGLERVEDKMNRFGISEGPVRLAQSKSSRRTGALTRSLKPARIPRSLGSAANGLAMEISGAGQIVIPISTLQSAGLPTPAPPARNLTVTRSGLEVPFAVETVSGEPSLVFEAEPLSTDYSDNSTYVLSWPGTGAVPVQTAAFSSAGDPKRAGYTRVERNSLYVVSVAPGSDPWEWGFLIGDGRTWPYADWDPTVGGFDLPALGAITPVSVPVKIRFVGRTDHHHLVSAQINGYSVGTVSFENQQAVVLEGSIPQAILREAGNELALVYRAEHDDGSLASAGYAYLDYVDLAIPLKPVPSSASLASLRDYEPKMNGMNGVKYLILTNSLFREQADRLAALKTAAKLKALVVDVQTAYDRFSGGVPEPNAILKAIREVASASNKLEYVVLFGDDTFDPKNNYGGDMTSYVPSILGWDGSQRIPNENAYADLNDDGSPDIALGRIPVATPEEATTVVDKIEAQSTTLAKSGNVHLFASDDSRESDSRFGENAQAMSAYLPASVTSVIADVSGGIGVARNTLFGTWERGATMTHYFGHGGPEIWTDEALFSVDDVPDLEGHMSPTILLAWACQTQFFQNYFGPSVNEAMFLSPGSGSVASLGPVGITSPEHQKALYENVYKWLYKKGLSLGEIIRQAKVAALVANPANKDVVDGFMFLGDPSLTLPEPTFGSPTKGKIPK